MVNKYHPTDCPSPTGCPPEVGEYRFIGPASIYSFNSSSVFQVFIIDENGTEHPDGTFGGSTPFEREFKLCAEYVIRWIIYGVKPDCSVNEPTFHKSCVKTKANPFLTCLKRKNSDNPSFRAWAYACGFCDDDELSVHLFTSDGKTRLNPDDYVIVNCC